MLSASAGPQVAYGRREGRPTRPAAGRPSRESEHVRSTDPLSCPAFRRRRSASSSAIGRCRCRRPPGDSLTSVRISDTRHSGPSRAASETTRRLGGREPVAGPASDEVGVEIGLHFVGCRRARGRTSVRRSRSRSSFRVPSRTGYMSATEAPVVRDRPFPCSAGATWITTPPARTMTGHQAGAAGGA